MNHQHQLVQLAICSPRVRDRRKGTMLRALTHPAVAALVMGALAALTIDGSGLWVWAALAGVAAGVAAWAWALHDSADQAARTMMGLANRVFIHIPFHADDAANLGSLSSLSLSRARECKLLSSTTALALKLGVIHTSLTPRFSAIPTCRPHLARAAI